MRTLSFLFLFISQLNNLTSQELVSTAGNVFNEDQKIDWALGELIIERKVSHKIIFTQGFFQPEIKVVPYTDCVYKGVKGYPNPTVDYVVLEFEACKFNELGNLHYKVHELNGKLKKQGDLDPLYPIIKLTEFLSEAYIVTIWTDENELIDSLKILKH